MPKVSVIIPTYNLAKYICESVDSVLAQTYKDFELIIIDDGSKDNTKQVLGNYGDRIRYIYQPNKGVASARNRGICEARGEYIALLDADDLWLPDKLMKQVTVAQQNPSIDFIFCDAEVFNDGVTLKNSNMPPRDKAYEAGSFRHQLAGTSINDGSILKGNFYVDLIKGNFITSSTVLIRKACLERAGYFDESLAVIEDYDMWVRIGRECLIIYINSVMARYRLRDNSVSGEINLRNLFYKTCDVNVLQKQLDTCPQPYKKLIKNRILSCYKTAVWGYYNHLELGKVRSLCLSSLRYNRFQIKLYLYLIATFFPAGIIKSRTRRYA